jgi:hypothetical protein
MLRLKILITEHYTEGNYRKGYRKKWERIRETYIVYLTLFKNWEESGHGLF